MPARKTCVRGRKAVVGGTRVYCHYAYWVWAVEADASWCSSSLSVLFCTLKPERCTLQTSNASPRLCCCCVKHFHQLSLQCATPILAAGHFIQFVGEVRTVARRCASSIALAPPSVGARLTALPVAMAGTALCMCTSTMAALSRHAHIRFPAFYGSPSCPMSVISHIYRTAYC